MKGVIRRSIALDLKRIMSSWQFYIAIAIIVLGAIITFNRNLSVRNLSNLISVGTLNTFIYSNIVANNVVTLLAPVIAGLTFSTTVIEDMKTGLYKQIALRITPVKYIISKIISSVIFGGGVFLSAYILIFITIAILDPSASVRTEFNREALFGLLYDKSMLLYCFAFIGYTTIFGAIYSLISLGIAMISRNKLMAIGLPFFIYYIAEYGMKVMPENISDILHYFLPYKTFDIIIFAPVYYIFQLAFILIISIVLITVGTKTLLENGN